MKTTTPDLSAQAETTTQDPAFSGCYAHTREHTPRLPVIRKSDETALYFLLLPNGDVIQRGAEEIAHFEVDFPKNRVPAVLLDECGRRDITVGEILHEATMAACAPQGQLEIRRAPHTNARLFAEARDNGTCVKCGQPTEDGVFCGPCEEFNALDRMRRSRPAPKVSAGLDGYFSRIFRLRRSNTRRAA